MPTATLNLYYLVERENNNSLYCFISGAYKL